MSPQAAGTITVHFSGKAYGTSCGPNVGSNCLAASAQLYPQLLNQNGTVVATGAGLAVPQPNTIYNRTDTFSWSGGPFTIRMMGSSNAGFPQPDYVVVTYYDVYGP